MTFSVLSPILLGLGTGLALIVAIGAQNAYLLKLGIVARAKTLVPVLLFCAVSDAVLIVAGVAGVGIVIQHAPAAIVVARVVGAAFLIGYGCLAARRAIVAPAREPDEIDEQPEADGALASDEERETVGADERSRAGGSDVSPRGVLTAPRVRAVTTKAALLTIIPLTWLNPHVYLDAVVFLGSVANQQGHGDRWWWASGAIAASFIWFFAIGFGARFLRPLFAKPSAWRVLDAIIAAIMLALGVRMALGF